MGMTFEDF